MGVLGGNGVGGSGYSPRITNMILKVKSFPKNFDSMRIGIVKGIVKGLGRLGSPLIGTPINHFMGDSESVKKKMGGTK